MTSVPIFPQEPEPPFEASICSRCGDYASFFMDDEPRSNRGFVSECCGWPPLRLDVEPFDELTHD